MRKVAYSATSSFGRLFFFPLCICSWLRPLSTKFSEVAFSANALFIILCLFEDSLTHKISPIYAIFAIPFLYAVLFDSYWIAVCHSCNLSWEILIGFLTVFLILIFNSMLVFFSLSLVVYLPIKPLYLITFCCLFSFVACVFSPYFFLLLQFIFLPLNVTAVI